MSIFISWVWYQITRWLPFIAITVSDPIFPPFLFL